MGTISLTIGELEELLCKQKQATADYITRNLSTYKWYNDFSSKIDLDEAKNQLKSEAIRSKFPEEFNILKKYIK